MNLVKPIVGIVGKDFWVLDGRHVIRSSKNIRSMQTVYLYGTQPTSNICLYDLTGDREELWGLAKNALVVRDARQEDIMKLREAIATVLKEQSKFISMRSLFSKVFRMTGHKESSCHIEVMKMETEGLVEYSIGRKVRLVGNDV